MSRKPTTTLDTEVLLAETVGGIKTLEKYVTIYKEKGKLTALVKPKRFIPHTAWLLMHRKIKGWGGKWKARDRMWEVPLNGARGGDEK